MGVQIHPTAIVDSHAELGEDVSIGPYSIIGPNVNIGDQTKIGAHVLIEQSTSLGKKCTIHSFATLGTKPQDLKYAGEETVLEIGNEVEIREFTTLNRGTMDRQKTMVESNTFIMAYVHVAHDCFIGKHVILANAVNLAGHITIDDYTIIGGMVPVHQFVSIGCHVIIGGGYRVSQDVPPFVRAAGEPLRIAGLNTLGLRRRQFSEEKISLIKKAYRLIKEIPILKDAIRKIQEDLPQQEEVKELLHFIQNSKRGFIR